MKAGSRFRVGVIDPPWPYPNGWPGWGGRGKRRALPYPAMSIEALEALDLRGLWDSGAYVFVWATDAWLEEAMRLLRAWRLVRRQTLVWAKSPVGNGPGGLFASTVEFVLVCQREGPRSHSRTAQRLPNAPRPASSWFSWDRGGHSEKPEALQDLIDEMLPGPRLELFARRVRPGWVGVGNEIDGRDIVDALADLRRLDAAPHQLREVPAPAQVPVQQTALFDRGAA